MKKLICILLLVCVSATAAAESIDLTGLSFDQLIALKESINMELWQRDDWQEVTVPQGVWLVGKDIPAGKWLITALQTQDGKTYVQYGSKLEKNKNEIEYRYMKDYFWVYSKQHSHLGSSDVTEFVVDLTDGDYVVISPSYGPAVFSTYTGNPSFVFK